MTILTVRTDKPEAELALYEDDKQLDQEVWNAHRELSNTIHTKIEQVLSRHKKELHDIDAIACYQGPGSFTGLRIGLSVTNALANSLGVPIVGSTGEHWQTSAINRLVSGENETMVVPKYGAPVHITQQKK